VDDIKTATTALGRRCAVTVDDSVANRRNVKLGGVRSIRRNPHLGQQQNVQFVSNDIMDQCRLVKGRTTTATQTDRDLAPCRRKHQQQSNEDGRRQSLRLRSIDTVGNGRKSTVGDTSAES